MQALNENVSGRPVPALNISEVILEGLRLKWAIPPDLPPMMVVLNYMTHMPASEYSHGNTV